MSRERMTRRAGKTLLAEIQELEEELGADAAAEVVEEAGSEADEALLGDAAEIADDEADAVGADEELPGQNERANANWPLSAAERAKVARKLVELAKKLM